MSVSGRSSLWVRNSFRCFLLNTVASKTSSDVQFLVVLADVRVLQMPPPSIFAAYVFGDVRKADPHNYTAYTFLSQSFFPQCTLPPPAASSCRPRDSASVSVCGNSVVYWPRQSIISVYSKNWQLKGENSEFILPFSCKLCFRGTQ